MNVSPFLLRQDLDQAAVTFENYIARFFAENEERYAYGGSL